MWKIYYMQNNINQLRPMLICINGKKSQTSGFFMDDLYGLNDTQLFTHGRKGFNGLI